MMNLTHLFILVLVAYLGIFAVSTGLVRYLMKTIRDLKRTRTIVARKQCIKLKPIYRRVCSMVATLNIFAITILIPLGMNVIHIR